jgi:poly(U)-specific endoribonuclease
VVTLTYKWDAFDYVQQQFRPLTKPIGGFWIGPSADALLAMGTIAFLPEAHAPRQAVINGFRYNLKAYAGSTTRNLRTFYPEFAGPA